MEIIFELENKDIDAVFIPDFRIPNHAEHNKVQWKFSNSPNTRNMDDVFLQLENEESICGSSNSLGNLRLLY